MSKRRQICTRHLSLIVAAVIAVVSLGLGSSSAQEPATIQITFEKEILGEASFTERFDLRLDYGAAYLNLGFGESQVFEARSNEQLWMNEELNGDFVLESLICDGANVPVSGSSFSGDAFIPTGDQDMTCRLINRRLPRISLSLTKSAPNADAEEFEFEVAYSGQTVSIADGDTAVFDLPVNGTEISVTERSTQRWRLAEVQCTDNVDVSSVTSLPGTGVFSLGTPTTNVSCLITNERVPAVAVSITTEVLGPDASGTFSLTATTDQTSAAGTVVDVDLGAGETSTFAVEAGVDVSISLRLPVHLEFVELRCTGAEVLSSFGSATVLESWAGGSIKLGSGEVACIVVVGPRPGVGLTITKQAPGAVADEQFVFGYDTETRYPFDRTYDGRVLLSGESVTFWLPRDSVGFVSELTAQGSPWVIDEVMCIGATADPQLIRRSFNSSSFAVVLGDESASCTVVNRRNVDPMPGATVVPTPSTTVPPIAPAANSPGPIDNVPADTSDSPFEVAQPVAPVAAATTVPAGQLPEPQTSAPVTMIPSAEIAHTGIEIETALVGFALLGVGAAATGEARRRGRDGGMTAKNTA